VRALVPSSYVARWRADCPLSRTFLRRIGHQACAWTRTGFSARQTCSSGTGAGSASDSLIPSELSLGPLGWAGTDVASRGKSAFDILLCRCDRGRHFSNHRTHRLLFRPEAISCACLLTLNAKPRPIDFYVFCSSIAEVCSRPTELRGTAARTSTNLQGASQ
jgi:hypothetical protein